MYSEENKSYLKTHGLLLVYVLQIQIIFIKLLEENCLRTKGQSLVVDKYLDCNWWKKNNPGVL